MKPASAQKHKLKRFYQDVAVAETADGWQVLLDGKPMLTPARHPLVLPAEKLAEGVAGEWRAQGKEVDLDTMHLTQFSCAALDYARPFRQDVVEETVAYGQTDVLCYRADAGSELAARQDIAWNPLVARAEACHGVVVATQAGIMPFTQNPETERVLRAVVEAVPLFELTALWLMAKLTGSLLLPLLVHGNMLPAEEAFILSRLEETAQNEQWGEDGEARAAREAAQREMAAVGRFLAALAV